jgi:biotin transport system substrate-specific component
VSSTALVPSLVRPNSRAAAVVADIVLVVLGVTLIGLSAQISIPLPNTPVPVTGQTFGAFATMALYLVAGGIGIGVFAAHASGWDVLRFSSATGGYLVGMLLAAALVGALADHGWDRRVPWALMTMVLGNLVIYAFGFVWLQHATHFTAEQTWYAGVRPFLPGDAIKILLAAGVLPAAWKLVDAVRR